MVQSVSPRDVRFVGVSLDCADPAELADFYLQLLGGRLLWTRPTSAAVQTPGVLLIPQRVADYRPPVWPGASVVHLDLTAGEHHEEPTRRAIALGARLADPQPDLRWRVLLDPAGHPFCITTVEPPPSCWPTSSTGGTTTVDQWLPWPTDLRCSQADRSPGRLRYSHRPRHHARGNG